MSLNIKNEQTHALARELAEITGESITGAVTVAVRERLDRLQQRGRKGMAAQLMAIGADCAARLPESFRSINPDDLLFDENGMPK
jgi:antitoxin VapB